MLAAMMAPPSRTLRRTSLNSRSPVSHAANQPVRPRARRTAPKVLTQALGLVDANELLELTGRICLDAGPLRLEQRAVHFPLGPLLGVTGPARRGAAGQDDRRTCEQQGPGRGAGTDEALRDARSRRNAVVDVQDRFSGTVTESLNVVPGNFAPQPVHEKY